MNAEETPKAEPVTGSMLYDLVTCPHRVTMDLFGDPGERDKVSPFLQLLWRRGANHEKETIEGLGQPFLDLSGSHGEEKEALTLAAMDRGEPLIYSGRISWGDLLGEPDLLRKEEGGYVAGDIKSGTALEGDDETGEKVKKSYAVQVALYTDILEQLGRSAGHRAFVWDIHREETPFDLDAKYGRDKLRRLWDDYEAVLLQARAIIARDETTLPAYASPCKNCVWYTACLKRLEKDDDLTLLFYLGRSKRDALISKIKSVGELAAIDPSDFFGENKKTDFPGIGQDSLRKFTERAKLLVDPQSEPYLREPVSLPAFETELFFDIEVDPMRDLCYLHGFVERKGGEGGPERFVHFFTEDESPEAEEKAFAGALAYMRSSRPCGIYYYSKYERTIYRKLQKKYPAVCTEEEIEALFDPKSAVDLYFDVVLKATEWPARDYSIKTLAKYLGFGWRDKHPSGAASIEWFDQWVQSRNPADRQRILDYNEDDCRATRVLLDGIRKLKLRVS